MAKKYTISMDSHEANKLVKQYPRSVKAQEHHIDSFNPFSSIIDSCLPHVKKNPAIEFLEDLECECESLKIYREILFKRIDQIEEDPKKNKDMILLLDAQPLILDLEKISYEDKLQYHEALINVLNNYIYRKNLYKTWQEHSQRLGHFMGKKIPLFNVDNFQVEASDYFSKLVKTVYPGVVLDNDLINFILQYYNVDNLLSITAFLQELYVQLDINDFTFVQAYEVKRFSNCRVMKDGSLRFEFVAHYFSRHDARAVLMSERYILSAVKKENQIIVSVEEVAISFYDDQIFREFIVPVLKSKVEQIAKKGYELVSVDKSLMSACAQFYWECKDAKSLRDKLEEGDIDGARLFALAWESNVHLSVILNDPLLLGQICRLHEHLALIQKIKEHTYSKSLKNKLEKLQAVLSKLDPKSDYELDVKDKETQTFMLGGLFGLTYSKREVLENSDVVISDKNMIRYAFGLISSKLKDRVDFDVAKYLGEDFRVASKAPVVEANKKDEPVENQEVINPIVACKNEILSCKNNNVLVAKCNTAYNKSVEDPKRAFLVAYSELLKTKPDDYVDSFLMLNPAVREEIIQDASILQTLLQNELVVEKLVQDDEVLSLLLEKLKNEFSQNKNSYLKCLKTLVDHLKKPVRSGLLRDKVWQKILFGLLINDLQELPLILKLTDKVERGLWMLILQSTQTQLLYLLLSSRALKSKLIVNEKDLRKQITRLEKNAKGYLSEYTAQNNTAKIIAQSAKLNDKMDIDEAEKQTILHLERAKEFQSSYQLAGKKIERLSSELDLILQQIKGVDDLVNIIEENLGSELSNTEVVLKLYGYENIEISSPEDEQVIRSFSDFSIMKTVSVSGEYWEIPEHVVEKTNIEILAVLVLILCACSKKTYLPASFIRRIQADSTDIDGVLKLLDACFENPTWVLNLFNHWDNPPKSAIALLEKANEFLSNNFHANRDFIAYLCRINPQHLTMYLSHIKNTSKNEWILLLTDFDELEELAALYVNLARFPLAAHFREAFMTQPLLDKVLLFVSAERINALIEAGLDCHTRVRELSVNDPVFRAKLSEYPQLREKTLDHSEKLEFMALNNMEVDDFSAEFLGEWFLNIFKGEAVNLFHVPFLKPPIVKKMLEPSCHRTNLRVLPVLVRALRSTITTKNMRECCPVVESTIKSDELGLALLEADAAVLLDIFQLNTSSSLAKLLRAKLLQSDELMLKLFIELDESSLISLIRRDTEHFFVKWLISKNHTQLFSRRLYACERGSTITNNSLIGSVLADLSLTQLLVFVSDPQVSESLAFQLSHTVGKPGNYPLLLGVLKSKVERKKGCVIEFLKLFCPLNRGFSMLVSKQNNNVTNSAWSDFLRMTLVFIIQAQLSYKDVRVLENDFSSSYHWKEEGDRVALVSGNGLYLPCPQLYFLLMVLCKPNDLLKEFMHPKLGIKICNEFMRFSPQHGQLISFAANKSIKALACYKQFYRVAEDITQASLQQRKSSKWHDQMIKAAFGDEKLTPDSLLVQLLGNGAEGSETSSDVNVDKSSETSVVCKSK